MNLGVLFSKKGEGRRKVRLTKGASSGHCGEIKGLKKRRGKDVLHG